MNFSISEYYDIFTKFTNPFSIVITCLKSAGIAFLVFLLLVIFLRKYILVKRKHVVFKILAWSYIIITPLLAAFFGFKWGLIQGIKDDLKTHMSAYTSGMDGILTIAIGQGADDFILELTTGKDNANMNLSTNEAVDKFADLVYTNFGSSMEKAVLGDGGKTNKVAVVFLKITKSSSISYGLKYGIRKLLHDKLGMEEGASKELMSKKFKDILDKGLVTSIMEVQVDRFFGGMQKSIYLLFSVLLLIPIIEIVVAHILHRRSLKKAIIVQ